MEWRKKNITFPPLKANYPVMGYKLKSFIVYDVIMFCIKAPLIFLTALRWILFLYTPKYIHLKPNKYSHTEDTILTCLKLLLILFY